MARRRRWVLLGLVAMTGCALPAAPLGRPLAAGGGSAQPIAAPPARLVGLPRLGPGGPSPAGVPRFGLLASGGTGITALTAVATPTPAPTPTPTPAASLDPNAGASFAALFAAALAPVDTDADGAISRTEATGGWLERDWAMIDTDVNGKVVAAELSVFLNDRLAALPPIDLTGLATSTAMRAYLTYAGDRGSQRHRFVARDTYQAKPTAFGLSYQDLTLTDADGLRLDGWYVPAQVQTSQCVLLVPGLGSSKDWTFRTLGRWLAPRYHVVVLDLRANGTSQGDSSTLGVKELAELKLAVQALRNAGASAIAVAGMSMGGSLATVLGAQTPEVSLVIDDCGYATIMGTVAPYNAIYRYPFPDVAGRAMVRTMSRDLGTDVEALDAVRWVGRLAPRAFLTIHGTADRPAPPYNAEQLFDAAGQVKQLAWAPGADHASSYDAYPEAYQALVLGFLATNLR